MRLLAGASLVPEAVAKLVPEGVGGSVPVLAFVELLLQDLLLSGLLLDGPGLLRVFVQFDNPDDSEQLDDSDRAGGRPGGLGLRGQVRQVRVGRSRKDYV